MAAREDDHAEPGDRVEQHNRAYDELWRTARGSDVVEVERLLREFTETWAPYAEHVDVVLQARVMSDPRWGRKHPLKALALAWRFRRSRPMRRTLRFLVRPRFAG